MKDLVKFEFRSHEVRTVIRDGEPWFVAKDVCDVLGLSDTNAALRGLDEDEKGTTNSRTLGGNQTMLTVNESGLYALIFKSRKPEAKAFRKWVTSEVLPSIRKTGKYSVQETPQTYIEALEAHLAAEKEKARLKEENRLLLEDKTELEVKLDEAKEWYSIKRMEKLNPPHKFNWRELKAESLRMGKEIKKVFDQNYGEVNAYHSSVWESLYFDTLNF